jgi:hypothetical protein
MPRDMETCRQCGATLSTTDASCPSCGAGREEDEPDNLVELRRSPQGGAIAAADSAGDVEDEAPPVPAGTWASTSEHDALRDDPADDLDPPARLRRVREDAPGPGSLERTEARALRARSPGVRARAQARGLAIATEPDPHEAEPAPREPELERRRDAQVVAFPGAARPGVGSTSASAPGAATAPVTGSATTSATASSSGMRAHGLPGSEPGPPPKWLASELLRENVTDEPYGRTSRAAGALVGAAGAVAVVLEVYELEVALFGLIFGAVALVALLPMKFGLRAIGFTLLGTAGLVAAALWRTPAEGDEVGLASIGATLLAAAQLLRAVHRTSKFARVAMGLGIVVTGLWLVLGGGLDAMIVTSEQPELWLGPLVRALLVMVLAVSVLGFLDQHGDSGCRVWAWLVLAWTALEAIVAIATGTSGSMLGPIATPLFACVAALGWMQLFATTPGLGPREARASRTGDG